MTNYEWLRTLCRDNQQEVLATLRENWEHQGLPRHEVFGMAVPTIPTPENFKAALEDWLRREHRGN